MGHKIRVTSQLSFENISVWHTLNQMRHSAITTLCLLSGFMTTGTNSKLQRSVAWGSLVDRYCLHEYGSEWQFHALLLLP